MAERTRVPQVWLAILAISAGTATMLQGPRLEARTEARADTKADAKRTSGIYLESAETGGKDEPKKLESAMPQMEAAGMGATMATMGFKKPKMITKLTGDKASLRVAAQSTFLFVFGGKQSREEMMMGGMDGLPPNTSPKDYGLIVMTIAEGDRSWTSGKGAQVKCAVENVEPKVFRVRPETPLPPGEYAFSLMQNGMASMAWDFGVDGPTTAAAAK
jgi:hypothetical protein